MNREQADQIARKHHLQVFDDKHASIAKWVIDAIMEAVAVEREECAKVCDGIKQAGYVAPEDGAAAFFYNEASSDCADAIRARGE